MSARFEIPELAREVVQLLRERNESVATAESLTGGLLSGAITDVAGASDIFVGGVVAYQERAKSQLLAVDPALIARYGVVSNEVAKAMAAGARERFASTWALSTTGVAGPGPSGGVAAGTVWIAIAGPHSHLAIYSEELALTGDRQAVRVATIARAFEAFTRILRG